MAAKQKSPRNRDLAKIHLAKKQLGLDEETYRDMLWTVARVRSSSDLDMAGRIRVLHHLKSRGFKPARSGLSRPQARLAHHIWGRMADAGVVQRDGHSAWLLANTRHINGIGFRAFDFCSPEALNQVIEQLKKWAEREGVAWR